MTMTPILPILGTISYAICGGFVAIEEDYDLIGVLALAMVQAFGGGVIRNLLTRAPSSALWDEGLLVSIAAVTVGLLHVMPDSWLAALRSRKPWIEAIGLAALGIQGALAAQAASHSVLMTMAGAVLTAAGGGVIRDVLARRRPAVFQSENVYVVWAVAAGGAIGASWPITAWGQGLLFVLIAGLRLISVARGWKVPARRLDWR